jgi:hypothetical protein
MLKSLASGIILAALVTPALADEYWIVQDPSTQKCSIVEKKSTETATEASPDTAIGSAFRTRAAADNSMQRMRKCGLAE